LEYGIIGDKMMKNIKIKLKVKLIQFLYFIGMTNLTKEEIKGYKQIMKQKIKIG